MGFSMAKVPPMNTRSASEKGPVPACPRADVRALAVDDDAATHSPFPETLMEAFMPSRTTMCFTVASVR